MHDDALIYKLKIDQNIRRLFFQSYIQALCIIAQYFKTGNIDTAFQIVDSDDEYIDSVAFTSFIRTYKNIEAFYSIDELKNNLCLITYQIMYNDKSISDKLSGLIDSENSQPRIFKHLRKIIEPKLLEISGTGF